MGLYAMSEPVVDAGAEFPESLDSLIRAHAEPAYATVIEADRARFVGRCLLLLATDVVLYDRSDPAAVDGAVYPLATTP